MTDIVGLVMALAPTIVPAAVVLGNMVVHRARKRRHESALAELGHRYGFSVARGGLEGVLDGAPVWLWIEHVDVATGVSGRLTIQTRIEPPMDLGLLVRRQEAMPRQVGTVFAPRDQILGDPHFDARFYVCGDQPERVASLLDADVRGAMRELQAHAQVELADGWVRLEASVLATAPRLDALLHAAARLTRHVDAARSRVGPALPVAAHVPTWQRVADRLGFRLGTTPLSIAGELDGARAWAFTHRIDPTRFATRVRVELRRPLGFDLVARSRRGFAFGPLAPGKSVRVGNEEVDRGMHVSTDRPELAARVLGHPDVTAALRDMHDLGSIWIDGRGATLAFPDLVPAELLDRHLERVRVLAAQIETASQDRPASAGFYR